MTSLSVSVALTWKKILGRNDISFNRTQRCFALGDFRAFTIHHYSAKITETLMSWMTFNSYWLLSSLPILSKALACIAHLHQQLKTNSLGIYFSKLPMDYSIDSYWRLGFGYMFAFVLLVLASWIAAGCFALEGSTLFFNSSTFSWSSNKKSSFASISSCYFSIVCWCNTSARAMLSQAQVVTWVA